MGRVKVPQTPHRMLVCNTARIPICLLMLLGFVCLASHNAQAQGQALTPAQPAFTSLEGLPRTLADLRGHPAVVNFWATWCGPCREEMPRLQRLADLYAAKGVAFIAISLDEPATRHKIPAMIARSAPRIPVWVGATDKTLAQLQLGELVPATLLLDEKGEVIGRIEGEARNRDISSRLDWLLGGRSGNQPRILQRNDW